MKWMFRLTTVSMLIAAIGLPFFINNKQGEPMLSLPTSKDLFASTPESGQTLLPATQTKVYKWQDAQGVWHYGDQAPTAQTPVQTVVVDSRTNVIQGLQPAPEDDTSPATQTNKARTPQDNSDLLTLDRAMNLMQDAQLAAQAMEARNKHLNTIVGESEQ